MRGTCCVMSVDDMLKEAFGDNDEHKINFKIVYAVIYLLARQGGMLERQVFVEQDSNRQVEIKPKRTCAFYVTEVKMQFPVPKSKPESLDKTGKVEAQALTLKSKSAKSRYKGKRPAIKPKDKKEEDLFHFIKANKESRKQVLRVVENVHSGETHRETRGMSNSSFKVILKDSVHAHTLLPPEPIAENNLFSISKFTVLASRQQSFSTDTCEQALLWCKPGFCLYNYVKAIKENNIYEYGID